MDASCGNGTFNGRTTNITAAVSSNGMVVATFAYEAQGRRVRKIVSHGGTETQRFDYLWDGWLLVRETATGLSTPLPTNSSTGYVWGKDLSGTIGGAGGVGGLLYEERGGDIYVPFYDNNGNITRYCAAQGNVVASYTYDAFGNIIAQSGPMADIFPHRFSTKYLDAETGLYYYGYRFYSPPLMRWLNRDPIGEEGGENLYAICENNAICKTDSLGRSVVELNARIEEGVLVFSMRRREDAPYVCANCGQTSLFAYDTLATRLVEDAPWGGTRVFLEFAPRRVCCPCCHKTRVEELPGLPGCAARRTGSGSRWRAGARSPRWRGSRRSMALTTRPSGGRRR